MAAESRYNGIISVPLFLLRTQFKITFYSRIGAGNRYTMAYNTSAVSQKSLRYVELDRAPNGMVWYGIDLIPYHTIPYHGVT